MKTLKKNKKVNAVTTILKVLVICQLVCMLWMPMEVKADTGAGKNNGELEDIINNAGDESGGSEGGKLANTKLVTGTVKLIRDAGVVALIVEGVLASFLIVKELIQMQQADEQEKGKHKKNVKTILITAVLIMSVSGLLPIIFSYYQ